MPSQAIHHSEPWRLETLALLRTQQTVYAAEHNGSPLAIARLTFPSEIRSQSGPRHVTKPFFTGCQLYAIFVVDMEEDTLNALRSTCSFLGVTLEESILTNLSLGGGVDPMQLIIAQNATAVRGLMAQATRPTIEPRVETATDVPPVVPETSEFCVAALIGITQALQHNVGEVGNSINAIALDLTRKMEAHTTDMLANKVSMLEAFYDKLLNFSLKTDVSKRFDDLEMSQYATLNMVNNKTEAIKDLRIKSSEFCKQLAHIEEWKIHTHESVTKLQDSAVHSTVFNTENKAFMKQQSDALEDARVLMFKMNETIIDLRARVSTLENLQDFVGEAPAPAPVIAQAPAPVIAKTADPAAQVREATFTPLRKKL